MLTRLSIFSMLLFFLPGAMGSSRVLVDCEVMLGKPEKPYRMQVFASPHTIAVRLPGYFNGVIAGNTYSLEMILQGLRMTYVEFRDKFAGKKVLLVGEGFGELLPALLEVGAEPRAVDPLYALRDVNERAFRMSLLRNSPNAQRVVQNLRAYLEEYDGYLRPALAQKLPFKDGSFDFVISHLLISNLFSPNFIHGQTFQTQYQSIYDSVIRSILESGRVLKPGGEALHVIAGKNAREQFVGKEGILSPAYIGDKKIAKKLEFEMTEGIDLPMDYSKAMGHIDLIVGRPISAEISRLSVHRK